MFALMIAGPLLGRAQSEPLDDPILEKGRQHYLKHCASCHGVTGEGDGPLAGAYADILQNLRAHIIHHDESTLFQMIAQGVGDGMPAFATEFELDEIIDLMDYLYTLDDSYQQAIAQESEGTETASTSTIQSEPTPIQEENTGSEDSENTSMEGLNMESEESESTDMSGIDNMQSMDDMQGMEMDDELTCPSRQTMDMGSMDMSAMGMGSTNPMDAVGFGRDLDGDNDPDEIVICLQILEITEEIAPGVTMPFWVFAPDLGGMEPLSRLPGPTLRIEEGDHVKILVNNTHYFPHTLHMHGVIKPNEMDGVPDVTQLAIQPGDSFEYEFVAQNPGTHWYHCHVQTPIHLMMGLYGMLIIEPNRPENFVTPLVMTSKMPDISVANQEAGFTAEYVMTYQDIDPDLNAPVADQTNSLSDLERKLHREYNMTERLPRYYVLNGRSFPFTLLDSQIEVRPDEHALMRVLNAGAKPISLHLHGHHAEAIALDGTPVPAEQRIARDTFTVTAAQRVDLDINTSADGFHASGPGVWLVHDHTQDAVTTNGINPGGNIAFMVYDDFLNVFGLPEVPGDLSKYFAPSYYRGEDPVFDDIAFANQDVGSPSGSSNPLQPLFQLMPLWAWLIIISVFGLALGALLTQMTIRLIRRKP
jgi:mono/diheme cytochrome c family protein